MTSILAIDVGCNGAMVLVRVVNDGPEIVRAPARWFLRDRKGWDWRGEEVEHDLRYLLRRHRPQAVAMEQPRSVIGRRYVGVSQGYLVGRFSLIVQSAMPRPEIVMVPGQGAKAAATAWAILRRSAAEILPREELLELDGPKGEHTQDAAAIALAALGQINRKGKGNG